MQKTAAQIADKVLEKCAALAEDLPWYTAAAGGTGGALLGQKLLAKKNPVLGAVLGSLAGTGAGLGLAKRIAPDPPVIPDIGKPPEVR